jgi:hypothetical protein
VFLTSTLVGVEWSASRPSRFTFRERSPGTQWVGSSISPRNGLDSIRKESQLAGGFADRGICKIVSLAATDKSRISMRMGYGQYWGPATLVSNGNRGLFLGGGRGKEAEV